MKGLSQSECRISATIFTSEAVFIGFVQVALLYKLDVKYLKSITNEVRNLLASVIHF